MKRILYTLILTLITSSAGFASAPASESSGSAYIIPSAPTPPLSPRSGTLSAAPLTPNEEREIFERALLESRKTAKQEKKLNHMRAGEQAYMQGETYETPPSSPSPSSSRPSSPQPNPTELPQDVPLQYRNGWGDKSKEADKIDKDWETASNPLNQPAKNKSYLTTSTLNKALCITGGLLGIAYLYKWCTTKPTQAK